MNRQIKLRERFDRGACGVTSVTSCFNTILTAKDIRDRRVKVVVLTGISGGR